jgi:hypothetical protein
MSELRKILLMVKTTAIGTGSNQIRLGDTRYPMACLYTGEAVLLISYES